MTTLEMFLPMEKKICPCLSRLKYVMTNLELGKWGNTNRLCFKINMNLLVEIADSRILGG